MEATSRHWLSWLLCLGHLAVMESLPAIRVQGGGFSVGSQTIEVANVDKIDVQPGSPVVDHWSCRQVRPASLAQVPKSKNVAILIPFREQTGKERHRELATLLQTLLPYAQKVMQQDGIGFKIFIIEQSTDGHFNRGALMDVGFQLAEAAYGKEPFTVVAQDCDFVPDQKMIEWYSRSGEGPIHLASYAYCPGFGGVTIFRDDQYRSMDGYSHSMWGWGGEDDDAMDRWMSDRSRIVLAPNDGGRFIDVGKSEDKARDKESYAKSMQVWKRDNRYQNWVREGLAGLQYTLLSRIAHESSVVEHMVIELSGARDHEPQAPVDSLSFVERNIEVTSESDEL